MRPTNAELSLKPKWFLRSYPLTSNGGSCVDHSSHEDHAAETSRLSLRAAVQERLGRAAIREIAPEPLLSASRPAPRGDIRHRPKKRNRRSGCLTFAPGYTGQKASEAETICVNSTETA